MDLLSACPHRQFHTLHALLGSRSTVRGGHAMDELGVCVCVCVWGGGLVSMIYYSIFTIILNSNDHEHMITAEISLNVNPPGLKLLCIM